MTSSWPIKSWRFRVAQGRILPEVTAAMPASSIPKPVRVLDVIVTSCDITSLTNRCTRAVTGAHRAQGPRASDAEHNHHNSQGLCEPPNHRSCPFQDGCFFPSPPPPPMMNANVIPETNSPTLWQLPYDRAGLCQGSQGILHTPARVVPACCSRHRLMRLPARMM